MGSICVATRCSCTPLRIGGAVVVTRPVGLHIWQVLCGRHVGVQPCPPPGPQRQPSSRATARRRLYCGLEQNTHLHDCSIAAPPSPCVSCRPECQAPALAANPPPPPALEKLSMDKLSPMKRSSTTTGLESRSVSRSTASSLQRGATPIHRSVTSTNLEKATRIRLFLNGDRHFAGKNVVLDRRAQDIDHLLDLLSTKITHQSYAQTSYLSGSGRPAPALSLPPTPLPRFLCQLRTSVLIGFRFALLLQMHAVATAVHPAGRTPGHQHIGREARRGICHWRQGGLQEDPVHWHREQP